MHIHGWCARAKRVSELVREHVQPTQHTLNASIIHDMQQKHQTTAQQWNLFSALSWLPFIFFYFRCWCYLCLLCYIVNVRQFARTLMSTEKIAWRIMCGCRSKTTKQRHRKTPQRTQKFIFIAPARLSCHVQYCRLPSRAIFTFQRTPFTGPSALVCCYVASNFKNAIYRNLSEKITLLSLVHFLILNFLRLYYREKNHLSPRYMIHATDVENHHA